MRDLTVVACIAAALFAVLGCVHAVSDGVAAGASPHDVKALMPSQGPAGEDGERPPGNPAKLPLVRDHNLLSSEFATTPTVPSALPPQIVHDDLAALYHGAQQPHHRPHAYHASATGDLRVVQYGEEGDPNVIPESELHKADPLKLENAPVAMGGSVMLHYTFQGWPKKPDDETAPSYPQAIPVVDTTKCKFPFVYNKVEHWGCTTLGSPSEGGKQPWCQLREASREGELPWAFCKPDCLSIQRTCKADKQGDGDFGETCQFPFVHEGVEYGACTTAGGRAKPWCYTKVNGDATGVKDAWGYCGECKCAEITDAEGEECAAESRYGPPGTNETDKFVTHGCVTYMSDGPKCQLKSSGKWSDCKRLEHCGIPDDIPKHVVPDVKKVPTTIAFGSCYNLQEGGSDPLTFEHILNQKPDMWIWLGDNIYADSDDTGKCGKFERDYAALKTDPGYLKLLRAQVGMMQMYDDHDFGQNDVGATFPHKKLSKELFLDFFDVPADDERRRDRANQGVYYSRKFSSDGRSVKIIMLDTRYNRDTLVEEGSDRCTNRSVDMLGAAQWAWLEKDLKDPADVLLITSGIQVLPPMKTHHSTLCALQGPDADMHRRAISELGEENEVSGPFEVWAAVPANRLRLLRLLQAAVGPEKRYRRALILSGDAHFAELHRMTVPEKGEELPAQDVFEVTASGIGWRWKNTHGNKHRMTVAADTQGHGLFKNECVFPFRAADGTIYKNCTKSSREGFEDFWCHTEVQPHTGMGVPNKWGRCAPAGTKLEWGRQGRVGTIPALFNRHPYKINSATSNYGVVKIDWERSEIALQIMTPHESDEPQAEALIPF